MALGSLLIQKQLGLSDRELVEELMENPYFQYFIGLPGYQTEPPFVPSLLVDFRKRLTDDVLGEINEIILSYNTPDDPPPGGGSDPDTTGTDTGENTGTLILDATCAGDLTITFPGCIAGMPEEITWIWQSVKNVPVRRSERQSNSSSSISAGIEATLTGCWIRDVN